MKEILVTEFRTVHQTRTFSAEVPDELDMHDSQALSDYIAAHDLDSGHEWETTAASEQKMADEVSVS